MLAWAFLGHLVGDYLIQNDWMAMGKKRSTLICSVHCALWTLAVCAFAGLGLWQAGVLFAAHFAQDRTNIIAWWMDAVGQKAFRTGPCAPWSIIVVDNIWHLVAIAVVVKLS